MKNYGHSNEMEIQQSEYFIGDDSFAYSIALVTGTSRAGKSLFSRLLSTASNLEWIFEPNAVFMPLFFSAYGKIPKSVAATMAKSACKEVVRDRILLRNANFRPNDISSIYPCKKMDNIFHRLSCIHTKNEVDDYISEKKVTVLLDMPDVLPILDVFRQVFPSAKLIHIVRNGLAVARECERKEWYSSKNLMQKADDVLVKRTWRSNLRELILPAWLPPSKEDVFANTTDFGRCAMYWSMMLDSVPYGYDWDLEIRYEDMVRSPNAVLDAAEKLLHCDWTTKTTALVQEMEEQIDNSYEIPIAALELEERELFYKQLRRYGYEHKRLE